MPEKAVGGAGKAGLCTIERADVFGPLPAF